MQGAEAAHHSFQEANQRILSQGWSSFIMLILKNKNEIGKCVPEQAEAPGSLRTYATAHMYKFVILGAPLEFS